MLRTLLRRYATLVLMAAFGLLAVSVPAAQADGIPNISARINSERVLHGEAVPVTITATNPTGQVYGYNLSFRVVLPRGVSYTRGGPSAPTRIANQPTTGETTLIFSNVSDLSPNSSYDLGLELSYDPAVYDVPQSFQVRAQAFINDDPRYVPRFDSRGVPSAPDARSYTGFSTEQVGTYRIVALEIEKDEPSWEGEIMRGVHRQQTTYTLRVDNNLIRATRSIRVVDFLPAGLEFLSCRDTPDSTTRTSTNPPSPDEYPGSGLIRVGDPGTDCVTPDSVRTVNEDPDGSGPLPLAVYTRVEWSIGNLAATGSRTIRYRAAIPIRENTMTWNGTEPTPISLRQAVNLDNNNGPETRDEQELTNYATARGDYAAPEDADAEDWLTRTAEDWVVHKEADSDQLQQGGLTWWTLTFETSEYRSVRGATITDTLPDGLCPLDFNRGNLDPGQPQCAPAAGEFPQDADGNPVPYATAIRNPGGTWTLTWTPTQFPQLAQTDVDQTFTLRFPTRTLTRYPSSDEPILTRDRVTNEVDTEAEMVVRCTAPGAPDCDPAGPEIFHDAGYGTGVRIQDESSASQIAADPSIDKQVAHNRSAACTDLVAADYRNDEALYRPGDEVCWLLRVDFPSGVDTSAQAIRDFLPPGATYVDGSDTPTANNRVTATIDTTDRANGMLSWTVTGTYVPRGDQVFEHTIRTRVLPTGATSDFDVLGNLMKFSSVNTPGVSAPLRDQVDIRLITPVVDLRKGVREIRRGGSIVAGPFDPAVDGRNVQAGDEVTYAVDLTNTGPVDAVRVGVWDELPVEYQCGLGSITGISDGGVCIDNPLPGGRDRIEWTLPGPIAALTGRLQLTYTARVPLDIGPGRTLINEAGVTEYFNETNVPGEFFRYEPVSNIDPAREATANAPAADDPSNVSTTGETVVKTRTTTVTESGNTDAQATIGEYVDYRVTTTIPAGTQLARNGRLSDVFDTARQVYDPVRFAPTATLDGNPLPSDGVTLNPGDATTPPSISFPDGFDAPSGGADRVVVLTFRVRVADVAGNVRGGTLPNEARLTWRDSDDSDRSERGNVSTTIVEPNIRQAKTDDTNPRRVTPGDFVTYTLTTSNPTTGGNVSMAHEVLIEDVVPADVTPVDGAGVPIPDGGRIPDSEGPGGVWATWDLGTRTISKTVPTITSGGNHSFRYRVRINDEIVGGGRLTNTVTSRGNSLPSTSPDRRTSASGIAGYQATATDTLFIQGATVTKAVTPTRATIGDRVDYVLTVTVPAGIEIFDTTVEDLVPDAIEFDDYGTVTCDSGCPPFDRAAVGFYRVDESGPTTRIAWDLGDVRTDASRPLVLRLAYRGWVRDRHGNVGAPVEAGETAVNTAVVLSNQEDRGVSDLNRIPDPADFRDESAEARATVTVIEPELDIEKSVRVNSAAYGSTGTAQPGDVLGYQLVVTNDGDSDAFDTVVLDTADADVTDIRIDTPIARGTARVDGSRIEWTIAEAIAPGASVTLTYTARLVDSAQLRLGDRAENTADVTEYWGVRDDVRDDPANGDIDYRRYDGPTDDTVVDLDFPRIELVKTTGLAGEPDTGDVLVGEQFPWRVVVRNTATVATANDAVITDTLPPNWSYVPDSANIDGALTPPTRIDRAATGDTITWTVSGSIPAGGQRVLTFRATPSAAAVSDPGLGVEANVNTASATARDASGASGDEDGPYETGPDTATATLVVPNLTIDKTPDGGAAVAGEASAFRIRIENTGVTEARRLSIRDVLPAGVTYTAGSATANPNTGFVETPPVAGPGAGETTVVWTVATLAAGASVEITVPVRVEANVLDGTTLTNTASVTSDELAIPISDTGDLVVRAETDLAIVKSGPDRYVAGTDHTWSLRVTNNGPSDAQDVVVSDVLPDGTSFVSADPSCSFATVTRTVSCSLGTLAAGADRTLALTVRVAADRVDPLENTARVTTRTTDTDPGNDESSKDATPDPIADVSIVKTATPEVIHSGGQSTFALTVVNHGPSVARDVEVTDPLPSGLAFAGVDHPGCTEASGTVRCALGDLAVDAPVTISIAVQSVQDGTWENTATVTTTTPEPGGGGQPNSDSATVTSAPVVDLGIVKSGPATAVAGQDVAWTLIVTNHGPNPATGVTVSDVLPQGVSFVSAAPSQGGCAAGGQDVRCELGGLEPGASASIQLVGRLAAGLGATTVVNHAAVRGAEHDPNPANDRSEAPTSVSPQPPAPPARRGTPPPTGFDLSLDKRVRGNANPLVGRTFTYDLTVANAGPAAANGVVVTDTLPAAVRGLSARVEGGSRCTIRGAVVRCEVGTLAANARASVAIRVRAIRAGTVRNSATVAATAADLVPANDRASVATRIRAPRAVLRLGKASLERGPVEPGATARYRIRVTNTSRVAATGVTVCDRLPDAVSLVSTRGARLRRGSVCWEVGLLPARRSRTFTLTVRVHTDVGSTTIRNTATVTAGNAAGRRAHATLRVGAPGGGALPQTGRGGGVTG